MGRLCCRHVDVEVTHKGKHGNIMRFLAASPDAVVCDVSGKPVALIEAKCRSPFNRQGSGVDWLPMCVCCCAS